MVAGFFPGRRGGDSVQNRRVHACLPCGAARRKALTQGNAVSGARCGPEDMATTDAVFSAARCSGVGTATRKGGEMTRIGARQQGRGAGGVGPRPLVLGARPGSSGRKANCRRGDQVDLLASGLCSAPESKGNKTGFKPLLCHLETLFKDIYYNNMSLRLSLVGYRSIKFLHTKINESS